MSDTEQLTSEPYVMEVLAEEEGFFHAVFPFGIQALARQLKADYFNVEPDGTIMYVRDGEWHCYPEAPVTLKSVK